jgi:hypothetical protein
VRKENHACSRCSIWSKEFGNDLVADGVDLCGGKTWPSENVLDPSAPEADLYGILRLATRIYDLVWARLHGSSEPEEQQPMQLKKIDLRSPKLFEKALRVIHRSTLLNRFSASAELVLTQRLLSGF